MSEKIGKRVGHDLSPLWGWAILTQPSNPRLTPWATLWRPSGPTMTGASRNVQTRAGREQSSELRRSQSAKTAERCSTPADLLKWRRLRRITL